MTLRDMVFTATGLVIALAMQVGLAEEQPHTFKASIISELEIVYGDQCWGTTPRTILDHSVDEGTTRTWLRMSIRSVGTQGQPVHCWRTISEPGPPGSPAEELCDVADSIDASMQHLGASGDCRGPDGEHGPFHVWINDTFQKAVVNQVEHLGFGASSMRNVAVYYDIHFNGAHSSRYYRCARTEFWKSRSSQDTACRSVNWGEFSSGTDNGYNRDIPFGSIRDLRWSRHGWFASTAPSILTSTDGPIAAGQKVDVRLDFRVGVFRPEGPSPVPVQAVLCGADYSKRSSVRDSGFQHRDINIHSLTPGSARVLFQTGVSKEHSVDDDVVVADVCLDDTDGRIRLCTPKQDSSKSQSCQELRQSPRGDGLANEQLVLLELPEDIARLPNGGGWEGQPEFSPDGRWIAYLRYDRQPRRSAAGNTPCRETGACVAQASDNAGRDVESDESRSKDVWVLRNTLSVAGLVRDDNAVNLTADFPYPVLQYRWSCNSRCLLVRAAENGKISIYQIDYRQRTNEGGTYSDLNAWERLVAGGEGRVLGPVLAIDGAPAYSFIRDFVVSRTGLTLFAVFSSMESERDEVYRCSRSSASSSRGFADCRPILPASRSGVVVKELDQYRIRRGAAAPCAEACEATPADPGNESKPGAGDYIPGYVFFPPGYCDLATRMCGSGPKKRSVPVIVYLHGGPHDTVFPAIEHFIQNLTRGLPDEEGGGFVVVAPNFTGTASYGENYRTEVLDDWGGRAYRDAVNTIEYFTNGASTGESDFSGVDTGKVYVLGGSYGGYLVNYLLSGGGSGKVLPKVGDGSAIAGLVSINGVYDLHDLPCKMDQKWFAKQQFGTYQRLEDCEGDGSYYDSLRPFDPRHFIVEEPSGVQPVPALIVWGKDDQRVPPEGQSVALAKQLARHNESRQTAAVPFLKCEARESAHAFTPGRWRDLYLLFRRWMQNPDNPAFASGRYGSIDCTAADDATCPAIPAAAEPSAVASSALPTSARAVTGNGPLP